MSGELGPSTGSSSTQGRYRLTSRSKWGAGKSGFTGQVSWPSISWKPGSRTGGPHLVPSFSRLSGFFTTAPATRQLIS